MNAAARAAAVLASGLLPLAAQASDCPAGQHRERLDNYKMICVWDKFVADVGSLKSPAQVAEKKGWDAFDQAMANHEKAKGQYDRAENDLDAAERRLKSANCLQLKCNDSSIKQAINQHERQMDVAENAMESAVDACNSAAASVTAARAQEKAGNEKSVSQRSPTCPMKPGTRKGCPSGMRMQQGKCIK